MGEHAGYWQNFTRSRIRRRGLLRAGLGLGLGAGALALLGCGGSDDGGSDANSLVSKPVDSSGKAVKGGILPLYISMDIPQYNTEGNIASATAANHGYSRLFKFKSFKYPEEVKAETTGDAVASWEIAPDGLAYTLKLRPNQKLDPRAPTNGRVLSSADVLFSWERFVKLNSQRSDLANSVDKNAPIVSMEAPDANTVVVKLAFPYAPLQAQLSAARNLVILPVEADDKFKTGDTMRGSGAWRVKDYQRSAYIHYEANPDWYDYNNVLLKEKHLPIVSEYATGLAQLRAGNLATYAVSADDVLATKRDVPQLVMIAQDDHTHGQYGYRFGQLPNSPFRDSRVRQAISLLLDRDLLIDTFFNTKEFSSQGLEMPRRWNTVIPCGEEGWWLDPQGKLFGDNARYFKYDPALAKQLMSAAGHPSTLESVFNWTANGYGANFNRYAEVVHQMWESSGLLKLKTNNPDYQTDWRNKFDRASGQYDGIIMGSNAGSPDIDGWLQARLKSGNDRTGNFLTDDGKPDVQLDDMIARQRRENDYAKRQAIIWDIQRYAAKQMYFMTDAGDALGFDLGWPWLGNWRVYRAWNGGAPSTEIDPHLWIDESKKKKSA
jgi:ABC-type transport system substrate-binding protein